MVWSCSLESCFLRYEAKVWLGKQRWSQDQIFFITRLVVVHYARQTWFNIYGSYGAFTLDVKSMLNENLGGILGGTNC
jgi:hypothetical protein